MVICFDCSARTKDLLDKFLETEDFSNYSDVISCALENLAVLETRVKNEGSLVMDGGAVWEKGYSSENVARHKTRKFENESSEIVNAVTGAPARIPEIFKLNFPSDNSPDLKDAPPCSWEKGEAVPLNKWMFGQFNKLLPLKAVCRALAHIQLKEGGGVSVEGASTLIANESLDLARYLIKRDLDCNRIRDDAWATAFPKPAGKNWQKGRTRFANQFVGSSNKKGVVTGMPIEMRLINQSKDKKPKIWLTQKGWDFAQMKNPILDGNGEAKNKFTDEEITFLLNHISQSVPQEYFAYKAITEGISNKNNTPEKLDKYLERNISYDSENKSTPSFLSNQRSGAISRMVDLKLVIRKRRGVNVTYEELKRSKELFSHASKPE